MKNILVVGANSYVGKNFASYLSTWQSEYSVFSISARDDSWKEKSFSDFEVIYHCAAIVHEPASKNDPMQAERYHQVNTLLPYAVAQKAKAEGVKQFIFLSTAAVYGVSANIGDDVVISADSPVAPTDLYGQSKWEAEKLLSTLADEHFRIAVIRPPMIYGHGCKGNYNTLAALASRMPVFPKVGNHHFMIYIDNLCEFVRLIIDREDFGTFCPQNNEFLSTDEIVRLIAHCHGKNIVILPGFGWALRFLGRFTGKAKKAFGSLYYAQELCAYPVDYCIISAEKSVLLTERGA